MEDENVFTSVTEAVELVKEGEMLIVVDSQERENEGDLFVPAEKANADHINFMVREGRGLLCVSLAPDLSDNLGLLPMSSTPSDPHGTNWMISVDAKEGTTTGISAYDRVKTVKKLIDESAGLEDFTKPGHVFPLRARSGGVLERAGHTEATVDLARQAGLKPAGVLIEILSNDGTMARLPELAEKAEEWGIKIVTVEDLIEYRFRQEKHVEKIVSLDFPTDFGHFKAVGYDSKLSDEQHIALIKGELGEGKDVLVRVHSECLTGDTLRSLRCDCGAQMRTALERIEEEGRGVFLYILGHEGRGIGLLNKLKAMKLQEEGYDTVEANRRLGYEPDLRDYGIGAQILKDIGVKSMRLMTNNPKKIVGLEGYGLKVRERIPLNVGQNECNSEYLKTKKERNGLVEHN